MHIFPETFIDILTATGEPTGKQESFTDVHRNGSWHRGVHIWGLNEKGEILLQRRGMEVSVYPGLWENTAGGHVDAGDTSIETAQKELTEELGIMLPAEGFEFINTIIDSYVANGGAFINNEFDDIYLAHIANESIIRNEAEVLETKWIHFTELEQKIKSKDPSYVPRDAEYTILFPLLHKRFD